MKRSGQQPRLLSAVMEAIANLKEGKGSTQKKIMEQVQNHLTSRNVSFRNVMVQIKKAIKHGVESGLIKQKGGKFKLGLDSKDYAVFKNFQRMDKGECPVKEHRRRRRRRRKRSRRRRRRRRSAEADSPAASESGTVSDRDAEPTDRGRRRGRRRRRRRRRRGRRRTEERDSTGSPRSEGHKEVTPKTSDEQAKNQKNKDNGSEHDYDDNNDDDPSCGNPECLCNIKQEIDDPYRRSHDDFGDDYDH